MIGMFLAAAIAAAPARMPTKAAVEIAEQERAFARTCREKGMRAAFSEYFAPDAIDFEPGPVPAAASLGKNPDGSAPFTLDWEPVVADASFAGDLGWDTGPYVVTDRSEAKKPPQYGWFFSVWRRQPGGRWKVAMDVGTRSPESSGPLRPAALSAFPSVAARPPSIRSSPEADRAALLARDRASFQTTTADLWLPDARLHRDGEEPVAGIARIAGDPRKSGAFRAAPTGGGVSRSGDLGYTYGSYALASGEKGYYARVWKMTESGDWKIAAQIERPLPPDKK
ncbi:MAG TPA: nuclear transport factor 2 family protein [Thermoanaerobaculia bacterium]|nr:nuclear transport factor 2 family protein [Thermoanaerobaculia bacterium]